MQVRQLVDPVDTYLERFVSGLRLIDPRCRRPNCVEDTATTALLALSDEPLWPYRLDLLPSSLQQSMDSRFERGTRGPPQYGRRTQCSQCQSDDRELATSQQGLQFVQQNRVVTHFSTEQNEAWIENEGQVQDHVRQNGCALFQNPFCFPIARSRQVPNVRGVTYS